MTHEFHDNGRFNLVIRRYKQEAKYETEFIDKVKEDFSHHSFESVDDAEKHLRELALYHKMPGDKYYIMTGSSSKWVGGSVASKFVSIKIKPYGNFIVEISEQFKPDEYHGQVKRQAKKIELEDGKWKEVDLNLLER